MTRVHRYIVAAIFSCQLGLFHNAAAQDAPDVGMGLFAETRTDERISSEDLSCNFYGLRLKIRSERFFEAFADVGVQGLDLDRLDDDAPAYGLGATWWLLREADAFSVPVDVGLEGRYHTAEYSLRSPVPPVVQDDVTFHRYVVQGVCRLGYGAMMPYLKAGIQGLRLRSDLNPPPLLAKDINETRLIVNVGVDYQVNEQLTVSVEANHAASIGAGIYVIYWF